MFTSNKCLFYSVLLFDPNIIYGIIYLYSTYIQYKFSIFHLINDKCGLELCANEAIAQQNLELPSVCVNVVFPLNKTSLTKTPVCPVAFIDSLCL